MRQFTASILLCLLPVVVFGANPFKEGNKSYLSGDYGKALEEYSKFIKDKPGHFEGYYNAGNALYRQEQYENALQMYNKALELNPKDEDTKINIQVTEEKIKKQEQNKDNKENKDNKDNKEGKDNKQDKGGQGKDNKEKQGQQGKGQEQQNKEGQGQQSGKEGQKGGQGQPQAAQEPDPQKELGMSKDEVQALMNMMQKSEKDYKNYFGKQYRHKQNDNDFPNVFNMSPEEIHNYMMRQMMEPDDMRQAPKTGGGNEKDW